jgi:hypothetical protein
MSFNGASAVMDVHSISSNSSVPKSSSSSSSTAAAAIVNEKSPAIDGYYSMDVDEYHAADLPTASRRSKYNIFYRFGSWYSKRVDESPVLTKSATGGLSAILGDLLAQYIENNTSLRSDSTEGLHAQRILAVFLTGLCYGPILHYFYTFMEHQLPIQQCEDPPCLDGDNDTKDEITDYSNSAVLDEYIPRYSCHSTMLHSYFPFSKTKYLNAFLHVAIDQGFMAFPFVALMMVITGVVEGHYSELREEFETVYIQNVHALWIAALLGMGPMQIIAFRYLSLKWRNLVANILDVIEVMVMSYVTHRTREAPN